MVKPRPGKRLSLWLTVILLSLVFAGCYQFFGLFDDSHDAPLGPYEGIVAVEERPDLLQSRKDTSGLVLEVVEYLEQNYYAAHWELLWGPHQKARRTFEYYSVGNAEALPEKDWLEVREFILEKAAERGFTEIIFEVSEPNNHDIKILNRDYGDEFSFATKDSSVIGLKLAKRAVPVNPPGWPAGTGLPERLL